MHSVSFDVWDVGGPAIERGFWRLFLAGADAVILVIDSTDHVRMPEAEQALNELLAAPELEKAPLLILANKQVRCCRRRHTERVLPRVLCPSQRLRHSFAATWPPSPLPSSERNACWLALLTPITVLLQLTHQVHSRWCWQ